MLQADAGLCLTSTNYFDRRSILLSPATQNPVVSSKTTVAGYEPAFLKPYERQINRLDSQFESRPLRQQILPH
jgi:hypothetical protein